MPLDIVSIQRNLLYCAIMDRLRGATCCPDCGSRQWWRHTIPIYHYCADCEQGWFCCDRMGYNELEHYIGMYLDDALKPIPKKQRSFFELMDDR